MGNKYPWETHPTIWKTKGAFFKWLRGSLRHGLWNTYPIKIDYKNNNVSVPPVDYIGKAKSGAYCSLSGEWIAKSYLEVDHIQGEASLKEWSDIPKFIDHLLLCHNNLALVSKKAHKIKSHAERMGISYEESAIEKQVNIFKNKKADEQKQILVTFGVTDEMLSNKTKRINAYRKIIKEK